MEKINKLIKNIEGWITVLAVGAIIVSVNVILHNFRIRADLTEDKLYTLNQGTISILQNLKRPVSLKFFFNHSSPAVPIPLKNYAGRVEDLLKEYQLIAGDKLTVEIIDPEPDSDAEEWAQRYGLQGQAVEMFGPQIYCGLVAVAGDIEGALPVLDPQIEEKLEYDISRLILRVLNPEQPVIGVLGALAVTGSDAPPYPSAPGMPPPQQQPPWMFVRHLQRDYTFRNIDSEAAIIEPEIALLLVMHPRGLSEQTVYAIDQYVLRGGQALFMVDPLSAAEAQNVQAGPMGTPQLSSNLPRLFRAWGVDYEPQQVIADPDISATFMNQQRQPERSYVDLIIQTNGLERKEIALAKLQTLRFPFAGALGDNTGEELEFLPLIKTTSNAGTVGTMTAQFGSQAISSEYRSGGTSLTIAARLTGNFSSAFPDGAPIAENENEIPQEMQEHLNDGNGSIIVFSDTDFLYDPVALREERNIFGGSYQRAVNDNITLLANLLEQMTGGRELIAIRSRQRTHRPFTKVQALEKKAIDAWQQQEKILEQRLQETRRKIQEMQAEQPEDQKFLLLNPQQLEAIEHFRQEEADIKRELRIVRRNLRKDIEKLGFKVKCINILLMPLLVAMAGIAFGLYRRSKQ